MKKRPANLNNVQPTAQELLDLQLLQYQIDLAQYYKNHSKYTRQHDAVFASYSASARVLTQRATVSEQRSTAQLDGSYPGIWSGPRLQYRRYGLDTPNYAAENKKHYVRVMDCPDVGTEHKIAALDDRIESLQHIIDSKDIQILHLQQMSQCLDAYISMRRSACDAAGAVCEVSKTSCSE